MKAFPEGFAAAHVAGPLRLEDVLYTAQRSAAIAPMQVVRADRVVGEDHLRQAYRLAVLAREQGRAHADRPEVEFTRYLAGERQIGAAIAKMGIPDGAPAAVVVGLGEKGKDAVQHFVDTLGLRELDPFPGATVEAVRAFGVAEQAIAATTPERRVDLVLECVAGVDLA